MEQRTGNYYSSMTQTAMRAASIHAKKNPYDYLTHCIDSAGLLQGNPKDDPEDLFEVALAKPRALWWLKFDINYNTEWKDRSGDSYSDPRIATQLLAALAVLNSMRASPLPFEVQNISTTTKKTLIQLANQYIDNLKDQKGYKPIKVRKLMELFPECSDATANTSKSSLRQMATKLLFLMDLKKQYNPETMENLIKLIGRKALLDCNQEQISYFVCHYTNLASLKEFEPKLDIPALLKMDPEVRKRQCQKLFDSTAYHRLSASAAFFGATTAASEDATAGATVDATI